MTHDAPPVRWAGLVGTEITLREARILVEKMLPDRDVGETWQTVDRPRRAGRN